MLSISSNNGTINNYEDQEDKNNEDKESNNREMHKVHHLIQPRSALRLIGVVCTYRIRHHFNGR